MTNPKLMKVCSHSSVRLASSIFVLGRDLLLLNTRASVLRHAGYKVQALSASASMPTDPTDLIILCHTLTEADRKAILLSARVQPPTAGMLCLTPTKGSVEGFPHLFSSFDGPAKLVERVRTLLALQSGVQA